MFAFEPNFIDFILFLNKNNKTIKIVNANIGNAYRKIPKFDRNFGTPKRYKADLKPALLRIACFKKILIKGMKEIRRMDSIITHFFSGYLFL